MGATVSLQRPRWEIEEQGVATRRLELWVQILELNDAGDFVPVEVQSAKDVCTGGIFQLKQVCVDISDSNEV